MAIDTVNEKLALITLLQPWNTPIPISADGLGQDDKQHLLWEYPGLLWGAPAGYNLDIDGAMLIKNDEPYNWFILNADDGAAGVYNSDDAITNDRFDTYEKCGFDTILSALTHPWATAYADKPIWNKLGDIAEAILARSMGVDWSGTFRYRSRYEEEDGEDPSAIVDITDADVPEIGSNIERAIHNHVVVQGALIDKTTERKLLWSAFGTSLQNYSKGQLIPITIADTAYWPDPTIYDPFFAKFKTGPTEDYKGWLQDIADHTMIGAKNVLPSICESGALTQIEFDTSRPDGVGIKYKNNTGVIVYLYSYGLFGLPVYKVGGKNAREEGFIHDYFKDVSDIRKNGEQILKVINDFLIDKTQIDKVAEYHWKERLARHQYRQSLQGNRLYLLPGEWVNVDVGSAGYHEYLDYKGEFREIHWSWEARGAERTTVIIDEQESNWKAESNYTARFEEYGHPYKEPDAQGQTIVVASSDSADIANFYCDGTSDEDEINAAINYLAALGGGTVQLTTGTFYIDGKIVMKSNVRLAGQGNNTIIEKNCDDYGIEALGGAGTELTGIVLRDFKITRNAADTNNKELIKFYYTDNSCIEQVFCYNAYNQAIILTFADKNKIRNNYVVTTTTLRGISLVDSNYNTISDNYIDGANDSGIYIYDSIKNTINGNTCTGNGTDGIYVGGNQNLITGNTCEGNSDEGITLIGGNYNTVTGNTCCNNTNDGIDLGETADYNTVSGNTCYNNGHGIYINGADLNEITGNNCNGNTTDGIRVDINSDNNVISGNNTSNNGGRGIYIV